MVSGKLRGASYRERALRGPDELHAKRLAGLWCFLARAEVTERMLAPAGRREHLQALAHERGSAAVRAGPAVGSHRVHAALEQMTLELGSVSWLGRLLGDLRLHEYLLHGSELRRDWIHPFVPL